MTELTGYLAKKGVPPRMIREIMEQMAADAVTEAENVHWDRIFSAFAMALFDFGFESDRIIAVLDVVNSYLIAIEEGTRDWTEFLERLRDNAGVIVRMGDGDRILIEVTNGEEDNGCG
ncbi:MAG: hypothetical protein IJM76_06070 [Lachnospiraceae bacterium]|nr:hypothetical protein [Lachnospiraceae bacterium]